MNIFNDPNSLRMLKHMLETDQIAFWRYFFNIMQSQKLDLNWHHFIIAHTLTRVAEGEITRLIINIAPRYSKTLQIIINFIAFMMAKNPHCRFLHTSYSDTLVKTNSNTIKEIIQTDEYQKLWPVTISKSESSKQLWANNHGGGLYAVATKGQVTGFGAGSMDTTVKFSGGLFIDDPLKPRDARSEILRDEVNRNYNETLRSRLATSKTPVVIVMQRLHDDDLSGFLLKGGSREKWHHLNIPCLYDEHTLNKPYNSKWTHGEPIDIHKILNELALGLTAPAPYSSDIATIKCPLKIQPDDVLWPIKHSLQDLKQERDSLPDVFSAQKQQDPTVASGFLFNADNFKRYELLPPDITEIHIYCDTAQKQKESSDYTVFQAWGYSKSKGLFLLDQFRGKLRSRGLESTLVDFWNKHKPTIKKPIGALMIYMEDASSGSSLIQSIEDDYLIPITPITRSEDKVLRAQAAIRYIDMGYVHIPKDLDWTYDYLDEFRKFSPLMTHPHDDQVDATVDAINNMLVYRFDYSNV